MVDYDYNNVLMIMLKLILMILMIAIILMIFYVIDEDVR